MYIVYGHPYSQHSRRVTALLDAESITYELRVVGLMQGAHHAPEFLDLNRNHQIPVLVSGDFVICESNAILRFLCARHQLSQWYPLVAEPRGLVDQWLDWNQCLLSPAVVGIVLNSVFLGDEGDQKAVEAGQASLAELGPILDQRLSLSDYLVGDLPTIADLSVASNITQLGLARAIPEGEHIAPWYERICKIEGFAKTIPQAA